MPDFELPFEPQTALQILEEATQIALELHGTVRGVLKPDQTLVTEADQKIELFLREKLAQLAPDWSFLGEEGGLLGDPKAPCWVIDPIDGTTNFVRDIPLWCISIGAVADEQPVFGMIAVPEIGELMWGAQGKGAWHIKNGQTRQLNLEDRLPLMQEDLLASNTTVERVLDFSGVPCRLRNFGALAYHLTALARGSVVGIIAHYHKIYDVAAGLCLCIEAGCEVRYLDGTPWKALVKTSSETTPILAAPPATLAELLRSLKPKLVSEAVRPEQDIDSIDKEIPL